MLNKYNLKLLQVEEQSAYFNEEVLSSCLLSGRGKKNKNTNSFCSLRSAVCSKNASWSVRLVKISGVLGSA